MSEKDKELTLKIPVGDETVEKTFIVKNPNAKILKASEVFRAKMWRKHVVEDGVMCRKELVEFMREKGIWGEEEEKLESQILVRLSTLERELFLGGGKKELKLSEGQAIAEEMQILRLQLRGLIAERMKLEENTAENLAENAKFDFLVAQCCFDKETGNKVFRDLEDYLNKSAEDWAFELAQAMGVMMFGIDEKYSDKLPENKFLRENGIVDEEGFYKYVDGKMIMRDSEGNLLNEKGEKIDSEGNLLDENGNYVASVKYVDDLSPKTPKKRTTKKRVTKKKKVAPKPD